MHSPSLRSDAATVRGPIYLAIPGRRPIACDDLPSASAAYLRLAARRRTAMPFGTILDRDGGVTAHISSNGKIWADDPARPDWTPGAAALHDPFAAAPVASEDHPPHLNFSFRDWLRQRTELPRSSAGWTPLSHLHADYRAWCEANAVPQVYVHGEAAFSGMLRAHQDREPETRLVEKRVNGEVRGSGFELCFPRHLLAPIRVYA